MSSLTVPGSAKSSSSEVEPVSKVTFSPLNSEAMVVSIRTVPFKPGEMTRMETPKRSTSLDSKKRPKISRSTSEKSRNKSTMTDYRKEISVASQTSSDSPNVPCFKVGPETTSAQTPCVRHAAENISLKANDVPSDKISLCNNCSKSMLSYIFLVQDFLDSLTKEICGGSEAQTCIQCMKEEVRQQMIAKSEEAAIARAKNSRKEGSSTRNSQQDGSSLRQTVRPSETYESVSTNKDLQTDRTRQNRRRSGNPDSGRNQDFRGNDDRGISVRNKQYQNAQNSPSIVLSTPDQHQNNKSNPHPVQPYHQEEVSRVPQSRNANDPHFQQFSESVRTQNSHLQEPFTSTPQSHRDVSSNPNHVDTPHPDHQHQQQHHMPQSQQSWDNPQVSHPGGHFIKPMKRQQPDFQENRSLGEQLVESSGDHFQNPETATSPFGEGTHGIVSSTTNTDREVYDAARNGAGYEGMSEVQERLVGSDGRILSEAYVTMCRNNAEALGCLVVGTSLLLSHTMRTLCVLVSDGVSMAFREPLSSIFHVVQTVRSLDSLGTTKLALLEQPELGISFDKLNVWRLKQFHKCVYLNPDTIVIQNSDELFHREELSAVPDIGWPDCFNSGVFVFRPSERTFWKLLEFSDKQGSYDGGDQGLLNSYFNSWSHDISKKLSFIYNLMANVSYTYTPAFKKFGHDVKIVQFHGTFKPWHVKYFNVTGLISPASNVHPTYVEFVNKWIKMFRSNALRQLSQEIQSYASSQELICAVELLRFFPLPTESEAEFFLTPPSVRLRLNEMKLRRSPRPIEEAWRRKSAEFHRHTQEEVTKVVAPEEQDNKALGATSPVEVPSVTDNLPQDTSEDKSSNAETEKTEDEVKKVEEDVNKLPGAEVGNYQGMQKWEQGKMDYQGKDSSDSILKRLDFLMTQPKQ